MKLLRTIRLDPSDTFVFERAAAPGEWAVSGAFMFSGADPDALAGKPRAAFRSGFLGVPSLGWSTLVQIVDASEADRVGRIEPDGAQKLHRRGPPVAGSSHDGCASARASERRSAVAAAMRRRRRSPLSSMSRRTPLSGANRAR